MAGYMVMFFLLAVSIGSCGAAYKGQIGWWGWPVGVVFLLAAGSTAKGINNS